MDRMHDEVTQTLAVERVARVLAALPQSINAEGADPSAGTAVDADWPDHVAGAVAILKTLRVPDAAMAAIGDSAIWTRMVEAAIAGEARLDLPGTAFPALPEVRSAIDAGTAKTRHDVRVDETFPASDPMPASPGAD
jgi:hypothetical protein